MSSISVKWVVKLKEGEITRIFPANSVGIGYQNGSVEGSLTMLYMPAPDGTIHLAKGEATFLIDPDDQRLARRLGEGTVYVMNESGRTIGTYRLDDVDVNGPGDQPGIRSSKIPQFST